MKRLLLLFTLILAIPLLFTGCRKEPAFVKPVDIDDADNVDWNAALRYVFDSSVIPEIHIIVSQEQWDTLLARFDKKPSTSEFVECDVEFIKGNETLQISKAGLRLKGNTSRRRPQDPAAATAGTTPRRRASSAT